MSTPDAEAPHAPKGPVSWGLATAALAGAALFLAFNCPVLLTAGVAILALAATVQAAGHRIAERNDHRSESWKSTAAKITAFMECPEHNPDEVPGRFQTLIAGQEQADRCRVH